MDRSNSTPLQEDDALPLIYLRNDFYKKKFYLVFCIFLFSLAGIFLLLGTIFYLYKHPQQPVYFVTDPVSRLLQEAPLNRPNMTIDQVKAWVVEAVEAAYTYDYMNYRSDLQNAQKYFTPYGWNKYMQGLAASNNLTALTTRKIIQIGKIAQPPQLQIQGHMGGAYTYQFKIPVLMTYWLPPYDNNSKIFNPLLVTVIVQQQNLLTSYKGLGIVQMNAELLLSSPHPTPSS